MFYLEHRIAPSVLSAIEVQDTVDYFQKKYKVPDDEMSCLLTSVLETVLRDNDRLRGRNK